MINPSPRSIKPTMRLTRVLMAATLFVFIAIPSIASAAATVGYVVTADGEAYAQAPGEEARRLECDAPIYRHDLITTVGDPGVAIMSGDSYVRLAGNSTMRFGTLNSGPPDLDLEKGQVRMIDMGNGSNTGAISTPGLLIADTRSSSEAIVFAEKIWTVSMICSRDEALGVERNGNPGERMVTRPGQCTISKPKEPLYSAAASHDELGLLARDQCGSLDIHLGLADRFNPGDLASVLPAVAAGPPPMAPPIAPALAPTLPGCTVGGSCQENLRFIITPGPIGPVGPPGP